MIKLLNYFFILFLCIFSFLATSNNEKSYEDRLHSIYLKNYKNPVTNDEWSKVISF